ncbi:MAG TPA: glycosyl hydrolase [Vicinamibacteria bacterium]|nr:glycosyl hydrolase [Vicinamibacteria bacterium]
MTNTLSLLVLFLSLSAGQEESENRFRSETFAGLELRSIGPALMSGRIADIAIHPAHRHTWYVAVGSGGVFKTTNAGTSWESIFDDQPSYSIGSVTIDPSNPEVIWVGTGENVSGRHVGYGDGVYKSADGGRSWTRMGLEASEHIAKILVDPRSSDVVYVAAEGPLWSSGGERGVYKSMDGGETWNRILEISGDTGVSDLEFDPQNPDVVYAAAYQRRRSVWALMAGGPESGIYKTVDGGERWRELTRGLPEGDMGKIGLAVSPIDHEIVYATIEASDAEKGFYRSTNAGESWMKRSDYTSGGTGPHYYQEIYASPHKLDRVYQMDVWIHVTDDGGATFRELGETDKHSDNHALAFVSGDPDYLLAGSDGGLYESFDGGESWKYVSNLPVTQIYKLALDNDLPFYNVVGGMQDNGTQAGPSRTPNVHGIRNQDWYVPYGADGYACQVDPENPDILYVTWQNGNLLRYDRRNGELVDVRPQPAPGDDPERWNWDAPILISPHSSTRLYFASQRLWRSDDRGDSWTAVSGDLSRGQNRYDLKLMGRVWSVDDLYDNGAMSWYGNATTLSESAVVEGLIYVGTDDGLIQVTEDGGSSWRRIDSFPGVIESSFVQDVKASLHDPDTVFAVLDAHKVGDFSPYLLQSTDRGRSWSSITGDLPERHILWSIVQDHVDPDLLFVGTEFGIFFTADGGAHWVELTGGAPTIAFRDLEIQRRENDLVGASFGRGFFILDDYTPLRGLRASQLEEDTLLFSVRTALAYVPSTPLAVRGKAYQGGAYFSAPNPPFGAVFTYYLKEKLKGAREERRDDEKRIREEGGDVPFPGIDRLEREGRQVDPTILLIVRDGDGEELRRIEGPSEAGFHRVAWDLRYPPFEPVKIEPPGDMPPWADPPQGPLVVPGRYSVELTKLVDGVVTPLVEPKAFEVVDLENATLEGTDRDEGLAFQKETGELYRKVLGAVDEVGRTKSRLELMIKALLETPGAVSELMERTTEIAGRLADVEKSLVGDRVRQRLSEPATPSIRGRVQQIVSGHWSSRYGPTLTHRESLRIASTEYAETSARLRELLEVDLVEIERAMEAAGAPWTPGRRIP